MSAVPDRVLAADGVHEIEVSRSRFRAALHRVEDEESAVAFLAEVRKRHWSATHHCTAWRLGPGGARSRTSDGGEPAGTAGVPMLEVLTRRGLTDTVAVVTRWFGGTKLGAGGLVRAYGRAVSEAVGVLGTLRREPFEIVNVSVAPAGAGRFDHALRTAGYHVESVRYTASGGATFVVHLDGDAAAGFGEWAAARTGGAARTEAAGTVLVDVPDRAGTAGPGSPAGQRAGPT